MIPQLIQRQIPIGSQVTFELKSGKEVSGILIELGREHVTLECTNGSVTILIEMIGSWQLLADSPSQSEEVLQTREDNLNDKPSTKSGTTLPSPLQHPVASESVLTAEVLRKLIEIEERFRARSEAAVIRLTKPDFIFPSSEIKGNQNATARAIWNRVKDKFAYAEKSNELGAKFGRLQPLAGDLQRLLEKSPNSPALQVHLAYFQWLLGNEPDSLDLLKKAAKTSRQPMYWHNLAALALDQQHRALACYALERYFDATPITDSMDAWYLFTGLIREFANQQSLISLLEGRNRDLTEDEVVIVFETGIYLLTSIEQSRFATELVQEWLTGQPIANITKKAIAHLGGQQNEAYQVVVSDFKEQAKIDTPIVHEGLRVRQGHINKYDPARSFGFLRGEDGKTYFFHRSAVSDDDLLAQLQRFQLGQHLQVTFEMAQGPKGPLAIGVTPYRTIGEMFKRATDYAGEGEYPKAIAQIKKVLDLDPSYPSAQKNYEIWREYARVSGVPQGSNPYARAKRVQLVERDLDRAAQLLRAAINQGDNVESAVKDLAGLLAQQGKPEEAVQVLERNRRRIQDQQSVDNMLIGFYQNAGKHVLANTLLQKKLGQANTESKKTQILWQIAYNHLKSEDYSQAEGYLRKVLGSQPDNRAANRNMAICLFKQDKYGEAEKILNKILAVAPDAQAVELLEAIKQAKSGQLLQIDELIIETTLSDLSREISGFTQFYVDRCDYQGVPPSRVQRQNFDHNDILELERLATKSRTIRPRERAGYYLSAAKITSLLEDEDQNQFYKYLCRSFASTADAIVVEGRPLEAAREFYCESLSVYDGDRSRTGKEQDAENALVRFLYSTLGQAQIPIRPSIPSIDETLETVLSHHPDRNKAFDAIAYLVFRSRYAANRVLNRLYNKSSLQAVALEYLRAQGIPIGSVKRLDDFVKLWNQLIRKKLDDNRSISNEFRFLSKLELTTASLERSVERIKSLTGRLFFDLEQERAIQFQRILETSLDLCKQTTFEEQERLCVQIDNRCQDLLREIEASPTKLSVEEMYSVVEVIREKVNLRLEEIYESSIPQLTLRLPMESFTPSNDRRIEAQVVISNRAGCSPAESLELVVNEYEETFTVRLDGSLRGGDQRIIKVPIQVSDEALSNRAFSLPLYAQYRTRSGDTERTTIGNFSIRLDSEQEFEEIDNPYAAYAEGGVVGEPQMFYGREELISNIAKTVEESRSQSKCVVVYGQKRAGKSSILYHLKAKLETSKDLLILDLGNIGKFLDDNSTSTHPFLHLILWSILRRLEYAIEDKVEAGFEPISVPFPKSDKEFFEHPSPLAYFSDIFDRYKRDASKSHEWQSVRFVLLIDEFSYIYEQILTGRISDLFMKNWKALLQENYFNAVLVGQDVMPKFKQRFANEFGTTQDERVTYLRSEEAVRLIDEPIRIGGLQGESRYREKAIDRIIDLTSGSPFYIQILCNRLVEYMNRKRASLVTEADVEQVKDELIRGINALGQDKFDNLINSGDTSNDAISDADALSVLMAIAINSKTGPCSRNNIDCETQTAVDDVLDDLVKRDVVERERGQYYSIRVGLFKEWLIANQ